jgi:sacsin
VKILRNIIVATTPEVEVGLRLLDIADDLPIWPRISSKPGRLTAKEAIMAENAAFVVPWIRNYHQFAKSSALRPQLRINGGRMLHQYVLPELPGSIDGENRAPYIRLIQAINLSLSKQKTSENRVRGAMLSTSRLAARQDGKLCLASDLFDDGDTVFHSAFRLEAHSRFLMSGVRTCRALWNELGIRRRELDRLKGPDYLACLRALAGRLTGDEDSYLASDTEIVLHPLCRDGGALATLDNASWSNIARLAIFPVRPVSADEFEHRRHCMEVLASEKSTMCLEHIVRQEYMACCWSQTPFVLREPLGISFQKCGSQGRPTCAMVWKHLAFLAEAAQSIRRAQAPDFIRDLERTYEYLQLHLEESKNHFTIPNAAIWLNVETTNPDEIPLDVLRSSWMKLDHLLLDSPCNAPPLMTVQPFLGRYSPLLKVIGCESLHFPQVNTAFPGKSETAFNCVRGLWKRDFLTDVKFEAEGRSMSAHKVILASRSSYCEAQFNGAWALVSESNVTSEVVRLEDMTYATLRILIEFCYHDYHDWAEGMRVTPGDDVPTIADKLDRLLDVLVAADRWLMPGLHADAQNQVILGIKFFVRPDNVEHVKKVAGEANATKLRNYCEQYGALNRQTVMLANAETD